MEFNDFKVALFNKAKEAGFEKYELYYGKNESLSIGTRDGEVDKYSLSTTAGVSFRGILNGKMGCSYTEKLDEESVKMLVEKAKECAELIEGDDEEFIFEGGLPYTEFNSYDEKIANLNPQTQIEESIKLNTEPSKINNEIIKSEYTGIGTSKVERIIINSEGIDLREEGTVISASVYPIAKDGENMIVDGESVMSTRLSNIKLDEIIEKGIKKTLRKKGAYPVKSGKYKVIIENDIMGALLKTMADNFLGHIAEDGKTLLKDKIGKKIASEKVTLVDNPFLEGAIASCSFDDEGVPTMFKNIVENGVFNGFLHSLKTAKKAGVEPTGNGFKESFKSSVKPKATNLCIKEGDKSFDELLNIVGKGLLITDLDGLHSGANSITGDFSLAAEGLTVENGKLGRAVKQITVAGNFFDLLKNIEEVGNDFKESSLIPGFGSPSLVIKELSVAGE